MMYTFSILSCETLDTFLVHIKVPKMKVEVLTIYAHIKAICFDGVHLVPQAKRLQI